MSMLSIDTWTHATVTHVNKRVENHGQEHVHAKDIHWKIEGPNTLLDLLRPGLRADFYRASPTQDLPGFVKTLPDLRFDDVEGPFKVKYEGTGYMLTVRYGQVTGEQFELAGSEINSFKVDPKPGGTVVLMFRTQHTGMTRDMLGLIDEIDGKEVSILLAPPKLQQGTMPDSARKGGKRKDAPPVDTKTKALDLEGGGSPTSGETTSGGVKQTGPLTEDKGPTATDIFTATHGKPAKKVAAKKVPAKKVAKSKK